MKYDQFFWLHIKKSAGITIRSLLKPYYVEADRSLQPKSFIQASPEEYNDILNNYRVPLGEYQFRRSLFAIKFLYQDQWDRIYSFAFVRNPIDRCLSMFYSLYWQENNLRNKLKSIAVRSAKAGRILFSTSYAFDEFLELVQESQNSDSSFSPLGIRFSTHTAPMWEDITDLNGKILLKKVYRLDQLAAGINDAFEKCGLEKRIEGKINSLNKNKTRMDFSPGRSQVEKIRALYPHDFELYESSGHKGIQF